MQVQSDSPVRPHLTPEQIALKKHEINRAIEQMAAILSESLKDADVRRFVKREVLKKFDGDYEALFAYALNLRTEGGETFCTKLSRGLQYYQSRHSGQSVDSESSKMQIEQIIRTVPLFQFGIPFYVVHKWNPETDIPPVVCLPDGCDKGSKMERVKAFKDGQAFWIETAEYLKNPYPVVVLGINERLDERGQLKHHLLLQNPDNGKVEVKTSQAVASSTDRRFDLVVTEFVIYPTAISPDFGDQITRLVRGIPELFAAAEFTFTVNIWNGPHETWTSFWQEGYAAAQFYSFFGYVTPSYSTFPNRAILSTNDQTWLARGWNVDVIDEDPDYFLWLWRDNTDDVEHRWYLQPIPPRGQELDAIIFNTVPTRYYGRDRKIDFVAYWRQNW